MADFRISRFDAGRLGVICLIGVWSICVLGVQIACGEEIHDLARRGDLDALTARIQADRSLVDRTTDRGETALHFAADGGHDEVVSFLLDQGADIQARDIDGDAPLVWAVARGHLSTTNLLLDRGADINAVNFTETSALLFAVRANRLETARLLIDRGADLELANDYGRTPLLWCARETGNYDMAVMLLDAGANLDATDRFESTPIELVSWRGFTDLVNLFLDRGCRLPGEGHAANTMLDNATSKGLDRLYLKLLDNGVEVDTRADISGSWLHRAATGGSTVILEDLLRRGAEIGAVDGYGWTPLHHAAHWGKIDAIRFLLEKGADPEVRTRSGWSARNLAEDREWTGVVEILDVGASPRRFPVLRGDYMGQTIPATGGEIFAPDIVSGPLGGHSGMTISPDGDHMLWNLYTQKQESGYWDSTIFESRRVDGVWSEPAVADFAVLGDDVPFFEPGGDRLFFMSERPLEPGGNRAERIWAMDRSGDGWGDPYPLPPVVNSLRHHWLFSVARGGDLYFNSRRGEVQGVFVSRVVDGAYTEPEYLGFDGHTPFIAPDQSYLITLDFIDRARVNRIRYRRDDGSWGEPLDIRTVAGESVSGLCPSVSADGKVFFYLATPWGPSSVCWADAGFIEKMRP